MALVAHPIDLRRFATDPAGLAADVDAACRDTGFLLLTGHGVPDAAVADLLDAWSAFFARPEHEKRRFVVDDPTANRGYTAVGQEGLAYSLGEETPPDLFEAYTVGRDDAVGPYFDAHRSFFRPTEWPSDDLHETWRRYEAAAAGAADVLLRAMAIALELPEDWLVDRARRAVITTRAINYERAAGAPDPLTGQMRLGAHTDYGIITLLVADDVPGLQIFRDGEWHDVSVPPGTMLCNIGDLLERWTNDRWRSTLHRVVPPPSSADGPVRRRSVARFLDCEPDMVVESIPSCCTERPSAYPPVVAGEWLRAKVVGSRQRTVVDLPA